MRTLRTTTGLYPIFNSLLDDIFVESNKREFNNTFAPETRFEETDKEYTVEMAVPGLSKEDLNIEHSENYLTISNINNDKENDDAEKSNYKSFFNRKYRKVITLPNEGIDAENIKATLTNGVLSVSVPKKEKIELKRKIEIQ